MGFCHALIPITSFFHYFFLLLNSILSIFPVDNFLHFSFFSFFPFLQFSGRNITSMCCVWNTQARMNARSQERRLSLNARTNGWVKEFFRSVILSIERNKIDSFHSLILFLPSPLFPLSPYPSLPSPPSFTPPSPLHLPFLHHLLPLLSPLLHPFLTTLHHPSLTNLHPSFSPPSPPCPQTTAWEDQRSAGNFLGVQEKPDKKSKGHH